MKLPWILAVLCAAVPAWIVTDPAASRGAAPSPSCLPSTLNASAQLPATHVTVSPLPGSADATPATQISFLGEPISALHAVTVTGSVSGAHAGVLAPYSQGDGASFLPARPFRSGERVLVTGTVIATPFAFSFTVGSPDPIARLPEPGRPGGRAVQHFISRPDLTPARVTVAVRSAAALRGGDIFLSTYPGPGQTGPTILDPQGRLIWFRALRSGTFATNVRVQRYDGRPVLTWWQGVISHHGFGYGQGEIYSSTYRPVATVRAGNGLAEDLHELQLTPSGTALITAWKPLLCDLGAQGGRVDGALYDTVMQAIDVRTGLVTYEWDSVDHVPLADSYMPVAGATRAWPWDWFHLNSIASVSDGSILLSARSTWTLYDIDALTGEVRWRLGGREPSFAMGPGTMTAWQHDAREVAPNVFSSFDNAGPPSGQAYSDGVLVRIDPSLGSATEVATVTPAHRIFAQTQGDLQHLADGDWWLGFGDVNTFEEVSAHGALLFEGHTPAGSASYRTLRFPWSGHPSTSPAIAIRRRGSAVAVYASWNGATNVTRWRLLVGATAKSRHAVGSVARDGFETVLSAPAGASELAVAALDARGRVLAVSRSVTAAGS